jgi:hypothetical protein
MPLSIKGQQRVIGDGGPKRTIIWLLKKSSPWRRPMASTSA